MKIWRVTALCIIMGIGIWSPALPADAKFGLEETAKEVGSGFYKSGPEGQLANRIGNVVGALLTLTGVVFFILVLYGGFLWMTSRGNEEQSSEALKTIFSAIIGIIIVLAAYAITSFVFESVGAGGTSTIKPGTVAVDGKCNVDADCKDHTAVYCSSGKESVCSKACSRKLI